MRIWNALAMIVALFALVTSVMVSRQAAAGPQEEGVAQQVEVTLTEFALEPDTLQLEVGRPAVLTVTNTGSLPHDFEVEGVGKTEVINPGDTTTLELEALEAQSYAVRCTVPGHDASGMVGTLVVSEATGETTDVNDPGEDHAGTDHTAMTAEDMARLHVEGVEAFPAETQGLGNQPLEPTVGADGVKEFQLTASEIRWETKPGEEKAAFAYNGQIPGPRIDVNLGDRVRLVLTNELTVPTALHSHGLIVPNEMDGVPGLNQPAIMPGESFTYEFTVRNSGSHMYHSHFDAANQVPMGLLGAFVVHEPGEEQVDVDYTMVLNDGPLGFTINGKDFPATQPIVVQQGQRIRVRYMNEGLQIHPMHLHGLPQLVIAKDGWPLPQPRTEDTVLVAPGERVDVIIEATETGPWAFHCHVLNHAEAADGMFGMVTALIVEAP
jgi:FtsP/CotA-like multicopper oxidase with cupredoxin domain